MSKEPAPTSGKLKPTKKPSFVVDPVSSDSIPALSVAKSNAYVPLTPQKVDVSLSE